MHATRNILNSVKKKINTDINQLQAKRRKRCKVENRINSYYNTFNSIQKFLTVRN